MKKNERFPKSIRLHKKTDFQKIFKGKSLESTHFKIFHNKSELLLPRFGVIASRKIKHAVRRNFAKRVIREIIRKNKSAFPQQHDFIILAKIDIKGIKYNRLQDEILGLLKNV